MAKIKRFKESGETVYGLTIPQAVIDPETGLTVKQIIDNSIDWLNAVGILSYGIEWSDSISSTACTRIGNPELHRMLPVQSKMRGCVLNDDGTVNYYLDANDWDKKEDGSPSNLDGTDGMVMVEMPHHYERYESEDGTHRKLISLFPLPGFNEVSTMYISAYKATLERGVNKLSSVKSLDIKYRGGNNDASRDGTYRTQLGTPASSISLTNFRVYARNRGSGSIWNCNTYLAYKTAVWLYYIEYANFNAQLDYNPDTTLDGYKQGGLGEGTTNLNGSHWNAFNGYFAFIPCGYTDELGNGSGTKEFTMPDEYNNASGLVTNAVRYRGIEQFFGETWSWTDGLKIEIQSDEAGGESRLYIADDVSKYNSSGYDLYNYIGLIPRANGYVKTIIQDEIMPLVTGGGTTTYFADYFYTTIPATGTSERAVLFGGHAVHGAYAGLADSATNSAASNAGAYIGSRLCCHPNTKHEQL